MAEEITCGEYLFQQRRALAQISDLSAPKAKEKAVEHLSNIYAVSYQMNFERREPPSSHRGPAERETLDRELVEEMSNGLRNKAHAFQDIADDPWRLSQAVMTAQKGNGFPLIEMVNVAFLASTAKAKQAAAAPAAAAMPEKKLPAGPEL